MLLYHFFPLWFQFFFVCLLNISTFTCLLFIQARLSNIVEAEPDCAAAMDILGFALYHENNSSTQIELSEDDIEPNEYNKRPVTPEATLESSDGADDVIAPPVRSNA